MMVAVTKSKIKQPTKTLVVNGSDVACRPRDHSL